MASISLFFSLLLLLLISRPAMAIASSEDENSTSFIRASCSRTLNPNLCYSSLSPYATRVGHDQVLLARFAMNVTIMSLKPLSSYIASLRRRTTSTSSSGDPEAAAALKDCSELISDATDLVRKSEKEVTGLEGMVGPEVTWRIGNTQTWLSAAITDEDTCTDGFGDGSTGGTGEEVQQKVKKVKQLTSNALALVNSLVNS